MLTIIVCSRNSKLDESFSNNIDKTVGVIYELICIDNSKNSYSIASAYEEGIQKSKFPYLIFVHEDVFFHTQDWGKKVIEHLQDPKTGILGLAGGDLATVVPAGWWSLNPIENIIQSDQTKRNPTQYNCSFPDNNHALRSVVLLDGVLLCMRRNLFNHIKFDESLSGFHSYDYDISIQSIVAGFYNYVIFDITVEHFSKGNMNRTYYSNLIKVFKKWEYQLPLIEHHIILEANESLLSKLEEKNLLKLIKRLTRTGFSTKEIVDIVKYYAHLINSKKHLKCLKILRIRIIFIRISSFIRNKNNY